MRKYNRPWPDDAHPLEIEFAMIQIGHESGNRVDLVKHYVEAQKILWPNIDHHRWWTICLRSIINNEVSVFMGPSDSSKTNVMAAFVLTDWWAFDGAPLWMVSSTELRGAELRIWGRVKELFNQARERFPDLAGNILESKHCITEEDISDDSSEARLLTKGIILIPCKQGGRFIGMGAYIGVKPQPGQRLGHAGDEVSVMNRSFLDAYANWVGKERFKGIMAGNPFDVDDPLCIAAEPVEGWAGWKDTQKTQEWRSKFFNANVIALDGRDSPNNDFKTLRFPYLISKRKLKSVSETFGENSWQYQQQCVGKPAPGMGSNRVITRQMCKQFGAQEPVIWDGVKPIMRIGALDAAYGGIGGDRCVTGHIEIGKDLEGHTVINVPQPVIVPVSVINDGRPEEQIALFCKDYCVSRDIPPENFFMDARGTMAITMARIWSTAIEVVDFGGRATDRTVSNDEFVIDPKTGRRRQKLCWEHYSKFVTELWFTIHYTILSRQMRGLPTDVMEEGCKRIWRMVYGNRLEVETKAEMKERTQQSPDLFDWLVIGVEGARRRGFTIARLGNEADAEISLDWLRDLRKKARDERATYTLRE